MYLEKIELQGFKSFAHKTTIDFPRPETGAALVSVKPGGRTTAGVACIVGPNGSGKSNVVDSIRWVLGEQSLKSLRGKKAQDVIFSGSEKRGRLGMSQVDLHINNQDSTMPIDYERVVISRKLYRNGESEYRINKALVRLQDVVMLAAKSNFGQKSYSIVSQGSIDQVIMANPGDRKEYFDEAVGVKQYQLKRDQSLNKLENAWNNLRQVDALLTEITPRLNSLTRQVKRLERREKLEQELREIQRRYYGWRWHELSQQIGQLKPKLEVVTAELRTQEQATQKVQQQLNALEKEDTRTEAFNTVQQKYQRVLEQRNKLREEQLMLQHRIELAKQRQIHKALPMTVSEILDKLKEFDRIQQSLGRNLASHEPASFAQAREDSRELGRLIKELMVQIESPKVKQQAQAEADPGMEDEVAAVAKDLKALDSQLTVAQTELQNFSQTEQQQKGRFFKLQREFQDHQQAYNRLAGQASELRVEMAKLETHRQDVDREIKEELRDTSWLSQYQPTKGNELELHSEIVKLKSQLDLIGGIDPEIVKEYEQIKERHDFLDGQAEDLRKSIRSLETVITDLDDKIQFQFDAAFKHINREFGKYFGILFGGGKAELLLIKQDADAVKESEPTEDEADAGDVPGISILDQLAKEETELSPKRVLKKRTGKVITGIEITATPPGKKVHSITMLSGGERSLAAIALICAIIANNPPPFVILDEVDAALDEANSQRFSKIVGELAHQTQFIIITHNRATMHIASVLYGVTMGDDGVSHLLSLKMEEAEKVVRQQ